MLRAHLLLTVVLVACSDAQPETVEITGSQVGPIPISLHEDPMQPIDALTMSQLKSLIATAIGPQDQITTYSQKGPHAKLMVWPRDGSSPVTLAGTPIEAVFNHYAHLLTVKVGEGDKTDWHYFLEPIRWEGGDAN